MIEARSLSWVWQPRFLYQTTKHGVPAGGNTVLWMAGVTMWLSAVNNGHIGHCSEGSSRHGCLIMAASATARKIQAGMAAAHWVGDRIR